MRELPIRIPPSAASETWMLVMGDNARYQTGAASAFDGGAEGSHSSLE